MMKRPPSASPKHAAGPCPASLLRPGAWRASALHPQRWRRSSPAGTGVAIAGLNSPKRTVVSGPAAAVEAVAVRAAELGYEVHRLRVSHAFHSPLVAEAAPALARHLDRIENGIEIGRPARPVASTVTGALLGPSDDLRELLVRQVTAPVRFTAALAAAHDLVDLWIEVGPGRALSELAAESLDCPMLALDAGGPSLAGLLQAAGAAFALGVPVETAVLFEGRFVRPFDPERLPRFLASPCESAPVSSSSFSPPPRISDPVAPSSGEGVGEAVGRGSALDVVRRLVATKAELPTDAIQEDSRLLSDLHLNSISVGQLVSEAARQLGRRPPASPTDYSRATVAEVALALAAQEELAEAGAAAEPAGAPAGVDSWVRAFHTVWVPRELPRRRASAATEPGTWRIVAPRDHPLAWKLAPRLAGDGVLLCLPPRPDESHAALFLEAAREVLAAEKPARFLVVHQGGGGAAFARTLHLEMPEVTTRVVDVLFEHPEAPAWVAAEAGMAGTTAEGHTEARYDASGVRTVPVLRLLPDAPDTETADLPLGPDDVLLVTGGGKGIGAECALDLALASGARLGLLGRSLPESDPELAANLERMRGSLATGAVLLYAAADVTDAAAVAEAVRRIESELGPVTAVLHGAGANTPRPIAALDEASFQRTLAPKVRGLENVLSAVDPDRLRLLVSFGSIIGRAGLEGEADYATANEWLGLRTERFGREHPQCRCLTLEWSVWSGVGMGERLGTLESLIRRGITPIPPGTGVARLRELLSRSTSPAAVVVAGRFGDPGTVEVERPELPLLRFLERPRAYYPGVELVVDSEISADTDPHLADHVFRGEPLFAAVLGMEAMAQTAMALAGTDRIPVFEDVQLIRPVAVPAGRSTTVRVAALVREPGVVELVLRDASTGFATDHFRAVCRFDSAPDLTDGPRLGKDGHGALLPLDPSDLYGGLLFHRGRFRRLEGYRHLEATACLAEIAADGATAWFGKWLPPGLVLGDPGARDAAIHGIQACIPHATLLPTGVDRIVTGCLGASEPLVLSARERSRNGDDFVYDLDILDAQGRVRERWEGLRLHAVQKIDPPAAWRAALLAPYVERRIEEILPGRHVRVRFSLGGPDASGRRRHRPDGKPETDGRQVSRSHAGELVLEVAGDGRIGCDLEPVTERSEEVWRDLLGDRFALAELIAAERGETRDDAATRVWTAVESLKKAGVPHGAPLVLDRALDDAETGGWLLLRSGDLRIGTFLGPVKELSGPAALAVLLESAG